MQPLSCVCLSTWTSSRYVTTKVSSEWVAPVGELLPLRLPHVKARTSSVLGVSVMFQSKPKFDANKCKVQLKMLINRLNLLSQKKGNLAKAEKRKVAELLRDTKEVRTTHITWLPLTRFCCSKLCSPLNALFLLSHPNRSTMRGF